MAKFLVPLMIFLSASLGDAFVNHARLNHLIRFDASMSNPMNEPSCEPMCEPTNDQMVDDQTTNQRLEWDAELPNILSPKREKYGLLQKQDAKLPRRITISITQITSNAKPCEAVNGINTSWIFCGAVLIGRFTTN